MIKLVFLLFLSMWDKSCFVNMHHFLRRSCFLFKLLAWAALILVRHAAAETGTVLEGLGGFLLLLLFFGHMECYFNSAFSSKVGLESFTHW